MKKFNATKNIRDLIKPQHLRYSHEFCPYIHPR